MVEILRSRDQTGPLWWRFSSAIVALYSLIVEVKVPELRLVATTQNIPIIKISTMLDCHRNVVFLYSPRLLTRVKKSHDNMNVCADVSFASRLYCEPVRSQMLYS